MKQVTISVCFSLNQKNNSNKNIQPHLEACHFYFCLKKIDCCFDKKNLLIWNMLNGYVAAMVTQKNDIVHTFAPRIIHENNNSATKDGFLGTLLCFRIMKTIALWNLKQPKTGTMYVAPRQ